MFSRDRNGCEITTFDGQQRSIGFLYDTAFGRMLLKILIRPFVSKAVGFILNRRISCIFIKSFVKNNDIDMSCYEEKKYRSYNEFFCRKIKDGARRFDTDPDNLPSPCDSKLSVYEIGEDSHFSVKGGDYTLESLVKNPLLAKKYYGGYLMLFRLTVDDYHRYSYVCDGVKSENTFIKGVLHTVNPHAAERRAIYKENCREYSVLST
ncbi:MAG: phosphatidylserine decarboxylase, partial [Clostridia bacterium]|nr:phosphatidylserine decarboxylase [Clostridia bacterium]